MDTDKPKRGRPKAPPKPPKISIRPMRLNTQGNATIVSVRLSNEEIARLDAFCKAEKIKSRSEGIRRRLP